MVCTREAGQGEASRVLVGQASLGGSMGDGEEGGASRLYIRLEVSRRTESGTCVWGRGHLKDRVQAKPAGMGTRGKN